MCRFSPEKGQTRGSTCLSGLSALCQHSSFISYWTRPVDGEADKFPQAPRRLGLHHHWKNNFATCSTANNNLNWIGLILRWFFSINLFYEWISQIRWKNHRKIFYEWIYMFSILTEPYTVVSKQLLECIQGAFRHVWPKRAPFPNRPELSKMAHIFGLCHCEVSWYIFWGQPFPKTPPH